MSARKPDTPTDVPDEQRHRNTPPHGHVARGDARFLDWIHPATPLDPDVLAGKWAYWNSTDDPRADPAATWDSLEGWSDE